MEILGHEHSVTNVRLVSAPDPDITITTRSRRPEVKLRTFWRRLVLQDDVQFVSRRDDKDGAREALPAGTWVNGVVWLYRRTIWKALGVLALSVLSLAGPAGLPIAHAASAPAGRLVFTGEDGIYVQKLDSGAAVRVWQSPPGGLGTDPRWSPDGTRIAFEGPDGNVWLMNGDGSNVRSITSQAVAASGCGDEVCTAPGTRADSPRWSRDGASISYRLVERLVWASIWVVPSAGGASNQVAASDDICLFNEGFSPDGRPLFSRCATDSSPSNATYTAAAAAQRPVLAGSQLAYTADGSRVAFSSHAVSDGSVAVNLFAAAADGNGARLVAPGGQNPSWSRSGLLAYQVGGLNGWVMHVFDPATGMDTIAGNGMLNGWTPDGAYLYYSVAGDSGTTIWLVRPDGTGAMQIATGSFPDWVQ